MTNEIEQLSRRAADLTRKAEQIEELLRATREFNLEQAKEFLGQSTSDQCAKSWIESADRLLGLAYDLTIQISDDALTIDEELSGALPSALPSKKSGTATDPSGSPKMSIVRAA